MKRFGIPVLLSAAYLALILLVFSSKYGQERESFFPPPLNQVEITHEPSASPPPAIELPPETSVPAPETGEAEASQTNGSHPESSEGDI
ncbi:MAG: hypothetical protein AAGN35_07270 [Bacteroidota bacterium]